ncbi:hypothetical protein GOQ04_22505 [Emticicia sp. ODNR4P]|nr:hypothetical protein [Emticicia sp. ODNR4P]
MKELAGRLDKMVETAEKRYESARALRLSLISQKRADEEARREALGQIAEMTELLKAHNTSAEIEESSQVALEMAKWAFDNIYVAFTNAKFFWDNMAIFCDKLASEELREDIERKAKKYTREKRIKLFKKEEFVKSSIMYLANWKALQVVCAEYVEHSYDIRGIILSNIAKSPTVSEARAQMADLKKRILGDIEADKQLSQQATSELVELQNIFSGL